MPSLTRARPCCLPVSTCTRLPSIALPWTHIPANASHQHKRPALLVCHMAAGSPCCTACAAAASLGPRRSPPPSRLPAQHRACLSSPRPSPSLWLPRSTPCAAGPGSRPATRVGGGGAAATPLTGASHAAPHTHHAACCAVRCAGPHASKRPRRAAPALPPRRAGAAPAQRPVVLRLPPLMAPCPLSTPSIPTRPLQPAAWVVLGHRSTPLCP
jgi:hypothetical protein